MTNTSNPSTPNNQQNLSDKQKQDAKNGNTAKPDAEKEANKAAAAK